MHNIEIKMQKSEAQQDQQQHQKQVQQQSKRSNNFDWIIQPKKSQTSLEKGGLALGNIRFAQNFQQLTQNNIGAIISVFGEKDLTIDESIKHFRILISDNSRENIKCFFGSSNQFIAENLKKTNVLIHCHAGVSRSATVVAAYLMKTTGKSDSEALDFIRQKRPHICPNKGFLKQLKQYDRELTQLGNRSGCSIY